VRITYSRNTTKEGTNNGAIAISAQNYVQYVDTTKEGTNNGEVARISDK
jgi:hypothetical protein